MGRFGEVVEVFGGEIWWKGIVKRKSNGVMEGVSGEIW